jgi:5'(3')-deoxyribonucleotidase
MQQKNLVCLDCDGILSDFVDRALRTVNARLTMLGKPLLTKSHVTQWDFLEDLGPLTGLPDMKKFLIDQLLQPGWCAGMKPCEGAQDGLRALRKVADVHIVTSPWPKSPTWCYERYEWLEKYFKVRPEDVSHCMQKWRMGQEGAILIDDKATSVELWNHVKGSGGYVWKLPWNNDLPELPRVSSWDEVIEVARRA